ncbi:uncharacterized protein F5Z01DRAFT_673714 [Emericellopsis atlantica]|uniref:Protein SSH4 n=1 Tax=Emericellopsis atlantica TaxID=2614577 RepID=A0A9P7ZMR4_9HYPO|nr:uncharacterized protein F5Z01DRAFT_673714 [Emericellopsis atlantica]KAG9254557.1 hypothetical protein F5Z01DRAFT_673714 [Emericellopsis atlantica]
MDYSSHPLHRPDNSPPRRRRGVHRRPLDDILNPTLSDDDDRWFTPQYLEHSPYVQRLERDHMRRQEAKTAKASGTMGDDDDPSLPPGSHRGMAHTIVERPSPTPSDDEALEPLPTRWGKSAYSGLSIKYCNEVRYSSAKPPGEERSRQDGLEAAAIRANHPISPQCGIYYFEITILETKQDDASIGMGVCTSKAAMSRPVGWEPESFGYHGDDGRVFCAQTVGKRYSEGYNMNDVIGCGVDFLTNCIFFTKNGINLGPAFHDMIKPHWRLFPAVSMKRNGERILANFGERPFVYDIESMVHGMRSKIWRSIRRTDTKGLKNTTLETVLVQSLVMQFLLTEGHVDTATAFWEEMKGRDSVSSPEVANAADRGLEHKGDATQRQRIRKAVLEGDMDSVFRYTRQYYPTLLEESNMVMYKLRCRKFIELIRKSAEIKRAIAVARQAKTLQDVDPGDMDIDNGHGGAELVSEDDQIQSTKLMDLEAETIVYGRELHKDYANDPMYEESNRKSDIWSLLAYNNPLDEPHLQHLVGLDGRTVVAEELNEAILMHQGKSSHAAIENVYSQTSVLLDEARRGGGEGAFVSVNDILENINLGPSPN